MNKDYTTIKVSKQLKENLLKIKEHKRETYEDVIERLIKLKGGKN